MKIASSPKKDGYQRWIASVVSNFSYLKSKGKRKK